MNKRKGKNKQNPNTKPNPPANLAKHESIAEVTTVKKEKTPVQLEVKPTNCSDVIQAAVEKPVVSIEKICDKVEVPDKSNVIKDEVCSTEENKSNALPQKPKRHRGGKKRKQQDEKGLIETDKLTEKDIVTTEISKEVNNDSVFQFKDSKVKTIEEVAEKTTEQKEKSPEKVDVTLDDNDVIEPTKRKKKAKNQRETKEDIKKISELDSLEPRTGSKEQSIDKIDRNLHSGADCKVVKPDTNLKPIEQLMICYNVAQKSDVQSEKSPQTKENVTKKKDKNNDETKEGKKPQIIPLPFKEDQGTILHEKLTDCVSKQDTKTQKEKNNTTMEQMIELVTEAGNFKHFENKNKQRERKGDSKSNEDVIIEVIEEQITETPLTEKECSRRSQDNTIPYVKQKEGKLEDIQGSFVYREIPISRKKNKKNKRNESIEQNVDKPNFMGEEMQDKTTQICKIAETVSLEENFEGIFGKKPDRLDKAQSNEIKTDDSNKSTIETPDINTNLEIAIKQETDKTKSVNEKESQHIDDNHKNKTQSKGKNKKDKQSYQNANIEMKSVIPLPSIQSPGSGVDIETTEISEKIVKPETDEYKQHQTLGLQGTPSKSQDEKPKELKKENKNRPKSPIMMENKQILSNDSDEDEMNFNISPITDVTDEIFEASTPEFIQPVKSNKRNKKNKEKEFDSKTEKAVDIIEGSIKGNENKIQKENEKPIESVTKEILLENIAETVTPRDKEGSKEITPSSIEKNKSPKEQITKITTDITKSNIDNLFPDFHKVEKKEDLKTKVLEINKDMEDLKLSIERSLVELTELEASDDLSECNVVNDEKLKSFDQVPEVCDEPIKKIQASSIVLREQQIQTSDLALENTLPGNVSLSKSNKKNHEEKQKESELKVETLNERPQIIGLTQPELIPLIKEKTPDPQILPEKPSKGKGKGKNKQTKPSPLQNEEETIPKVDDTLVKHIPLKGDIDNIDDALSSSVEDVDAKFDMIVRNSKIDSTDDCDIEKLDNEQKGTQSKNLHGPNASHATSSKIDYKKEKDKNLPPVRAKRGKKKAKDNEGTMNENSNVSLYESDDEEYIYKYSFRRVFMANACHICKVNVSSKRLTCNNCNLISYCSQEHRDKDWVEHQPLCFTICTIANMKGFKYLYQNVKNLNGNDYRLVRMQAIVTCEKLLNRKLAAHEQEMLLYPRICAERSCREWRGIALTDCANCYQVSYCTDHPEHLNVDHKEWCNSYRLYSELVTHQQNIGRIEPRMPNKIVKNYELPDRMDDFIKYIYDGKCNMDMLNYAALTQLSTGPLTAEYCNQVYNKKIYNKYRNPNTEITTFSLHMVGAELQFEADTLNKWENFLLHLDSNIKELKIVFIGPELNPSNLPLELLTKIKLCKECRANNRKLIFEYEDGHLYHEYVRCPRFTKPDMVCAFNPGLHRVTSYNGNDSWPQTIKSILKLKVPFVVTSYTKYELPRDLTRIQDVCDKSQEGLTVNVLVEPTLNPYASVRPDRNFISDDVMPLIFKNYYYMLVTG